MRRVVISLGGSTLFSNGKLDVQYVKKLAQLLLKLKESGVGMALVVGGGYYARDYASAIRESANNEFLADRAAVYVTKANATLVQAALGDAAYPRLIQALDDASAALEEGKIALGCGILEGVSTDFDSMLVAERMKADAVVNASNTDGIYSEDPQKNAKAKKLKQITHAQLVQMASEADARKAGTHFVFDAVASKLAARSNIPLHFVNGRNLKDVEAAILGRLHAGTIVKD